jgi:3-hydroxyacyl-[acyl-carrier-protein] dehydratase
MIGPNRQFLLKNLANKMKISKDDIKKYLPHREPFLFIDEVIDIDQNNKIHVRKYISPDEYFLDGHFPNNPIFPGVIIIEALGQASGILGFVKMNKTPDEGSIYVLAGVDKVRFRKRVRPGDTLDIYSRVLGEKRGIWKFDCRAELDKELVCSAIILCADRKAI